MEENEQQVTLSLNSVLGSMGSGLNTMRIKGTIGSRVMHILVDTRSSHNFLNEQFSKILEGQIKEMHPLKVSVADGGRIEGTKTIKNFSWTL